MSVRTYPVCEAEVSIVSETVKFETDETLKAFRDQIYSVLTYLPVEFTVRVHVRASAVVDNG